MTMTKKYRYAVLSRPYVSMEGMFKCSNSKELKWSDLIIKKEKKKLKQSDFMDDINFAEHFKLVLHWYIAQIVFLK